MSNSVNLSFNVKVETCREGNSKRDLKIYNLFTRYFTGPKDWTEQAIKAKEMGFNTIYLNPFQKTGGSESLYSIIDYYEWEPAVMQGLSKEEGLKQIKQFVQTCNNLGLEVVLDFVSNHTADDSPCVAKHPDWYEKDENGNIAKAWCMSDTGKRIWGDCAKLDYSNPKNGLWNYMEDICRYYLELGFSGFRCDVAAYVPKEFWKYLISTLKKDYPNVYFMGEAFMVPQETIDGLAEAGFDYIFNSAKWWNGYDSWFFEQNAHFNAMGLKTISFPDNHDTRPLMQEVDGNVDLFKQRLYFMSVLTSGFEITSGFERGIQTNYSVITSKPEEFANAKFDFTYDIKKALDLRDMYEILHTAGELVNIWPARRDVLFLQKEAKGLNQKALFLLNITSEEVKVEQKTLHSIFPVENVQDDVILAPYDFKVYVATAKHMPKVKKNISNSLIGKKKMLPIELPIKPLYSDEVLVEIFSCGICGSDRREFFNGRFFWKLPEDGGHELFGKVVQCGENCKNISEGDMVCYRIPRQHTGIMQFGGFSQYAVIRENSLYKLPNGYNSYKADMIEPLACAIHIAKKISTDKSIAIVGSGTIALLLERYLSAFKNYRNINLIYKHENVCKYVSDTTNCIAFDKLEGTSIFGIRKKFDAIIECSGNAQNFGKLWKLLAPEGKLILTGIYDDSILKNGNFFSLTTTMFDERKIEGSFLYTENDFDEAAKLIIRDQIKVEDLITKMSFTECQKAFEIPSGKAVKTIIINKKELF